ncbi:hypothetical protein FMUND_5155 [Fusarium mundagurra]|uniref:Methyltransferase n=1 Tax=Fusarium mundagurra TaxID=1567541 RepID=A0A8H6DIY8_9HYPO|nr:hypothetical protein FMUND_5155 [Fusarium mundagurra]
MDRASHMSFLTKADLDNHERTYEIWMPMNDGNLQTDLMFFERQKIRIKDVSHLSPEFNLETGGFEFVRHETTKLAKTASQIQAGGREALSPYLDETIELVKQQTQAEKVICFDWRLRKNDDATQRRAGNAVNGNPEGESFEFIPPAKVVHQDESLKGGLFVAKRYLTKDEFASLSDIRVRIINVWRPIVGTIENAPLALCDRRSVSPNDIESCDKSLTGCVGEGNYLHCNRKQRWYWWPNQTRDRPVLFVTWDSLKDDELACPPHGSFYDYMADPEAPPRESIEVRALVINKKE